MVVNIAIPGRTNVWGRTVAGMRARDMAIALGWGCDANVPYRAGYQPDSGS